MKKFKKVIPVLLALVLVLSSVTSSMACTGVYVGSAVSANGSTYVGRSEDISDIYGKIFGIAESRTNFKGESKHRSSDWFTSGWGADYNSFSNRNKWETYGTDYVF